LSFRSAAKESAVAFAVSCFFVCHSAVQRRNLLWLLPLSVLFCLSFRSAAEESGWTQDCHCIQAGQAFRLGQPWLYPWPMHSHPSRKPQNYAEIIDRHGPHPALIPLIPVPVLIISTTKTRAIPKRPRPPKTIFREFPQQNRMSSSKTT
jgi:hypothetical protein